MTSDRVRREVEERDGKSVASDQVPGAHAAAVEGPRRPTSHVFPTVGDASSCCEQELATTSTRIRYIPNVLFGAH